MGVRPSRGPHDDDFFLMLTPQWSEKLELEILVGHSNLSEVSPWQRSTEWKKSCSIQKAVSSRFDIQTELASTFTTQRARLELRCSTPRQGKTQLFRSNCNTEELVDILKSPRVHTGHGYQQSPTKRRRDTPNIKEVVARNVEVVTSAMDLPMTSVCIDGIDTKAGRPMQKKIFEIGYWKQKRRSKKQKGSEVICCDQSPFISKHLYVTSRGIKNLLRIIYTPR